MSETVDFEAVVIGSGFGGTIAALTLTNYFSSKAEEHPSDPIKRVCLLERGQWWISHELPYRPETERKLETPKPPTMNMREFLQDTKQHFNFWAHPDNAEGMVNWASKNRLLNKTGLYDYRLLRDDVHAVVASGVGGGSLVYSNVTLAPQPSVYENWPTDTVKGVTGLSPYFETARAIIGTNKITTLAGLGPKSAKLDKSRIFQEAAHKARDKPASSENFPVANPRPTKGIADPDLGFALDLAITDVDSKAFVNASRGGTVTLSTELEQEVLKDSLQQNVCQRQGRCVLGCLPGSRHTLNKMLVSRLEAQMPQPPGMIQLPSILTVRALTEATGIELTEDRRYKVTYIEYNRDGVSSDRKSLTTNILVVAAGTLGTTELLLKSAPPLRLSKQLGEGFSTDGDILGFMKLKGTGPVTSVDNTRGPINTCHALFNRKEQLHGKDQFYFSIEDTTIPKMVAPLFATMLELYLEEIKKLGVWGKLRRAARLIWRFHLTGLAVALFGFNLPLFQRRITDLWNRPDVQNLFRALVKPRDPKTAQPSPSPDPKTTNLMTSLLNSLTKDYTTPNAAPEERLSKFFIFSCMGMDKANGRLHLPDPKTPGSINKNHSEEQLQLDWDIEDNKQVFEDILKGMKQLAKEIDPTAEVHAPTWDSKAEKALPLFTLLHPLAGIHVHKHKDEPKKKKDGERDGKSRSLVVLHPLGGCRMARSINEGVVDSFGQVYNPNSDSGVYDKFYLLDGSIVPTALGVNSSLTIAALALRGAKNLVEQLELEYARKAGLSKPVGFDGSDFFPNPNSPGWIPKILLQGL